MAKRRLPPPPVPPDLDMRGIPMPRELLVQLTMEACGVSEKEADQMVQRFFANGKQ